MGRSRPDHKARRWTLAGLLSVVALCALVLAIGRAWLANTCPSQVASPALADLVGRTSRCANCHEASATVAIAVNPAPGPASRPQPHPPGPPPVAVTNRCASCHGR